MLYCHQYSITLFMPAEVFGMLFVMHRGVSGAVRCSFGRFLAPHLLVWYSQNHNCTHLIFTSTCVVWCGLEFSQKHNHTTPHFTVTCAVWFIRCGLNGLKLVYFPIFGLFLPRPRFFPLFWTNF